MSTADHSSKDAAPKAPEAKSAAPQLTPEQIDMQKIPEFKNSHENFLHCLPKHLWELSTSKIIERTVLTITFVFISFHALSICPAWALPLCWVFCALAFSFLFELGHDCSNGKFTVNPILNDVLGTLYLLPLFQPLEFWRPATPFPEPNQDSTWNSTAWSKWMSLRVRFHITHLLVLLFAAGFFPMMVYNFGWWGLFKFWGMPFILFHLGMGEFVQAGRGVYTKMGEKYMPSAISDISLSSYLRYRLRVPSYKLSEAMDVVKRMWGRATLDSSDGPAPITKWMHMYQQPSFDSLALTYFSFSFVESALSLLLVPLVGMWVYLMWSTIRQIDITTLLQQQLEWLKSSDNIYSAVGFATEQAWEAAAQAYQLALTSLTKTNHLAVLFGAMVLVLVVARKWTTLRSVYLVDFVTFTPPDEWLCNNAQFKSLQRLFPFNQESLDFMDRLVDRTGIGEKTYFPPGVHESPPVLTLTKAREETGCVLFGCLDQLFASTRTRPQDVDILIVNCSLFSPTPSLTAMIVNKYKMREDIQSYNLSGMGCSAGVIAIHLAKDLLQVHRSSLAVVVSTESITLNWYRGNERSKLISNTLFRCGGAAVLLSNKRRDRVRSKYQLNHTVRTHRGADDESYRSVFQEPDADGIIGVRLDQSLMKVAGEALKRNITTLGPLILPWSEQFKFFLNVVKRRVFKVKGKPFVPDFTKGIDHFCIHAGGKRVIEAIKEALSLSPKAIEASQAVLKRYGNTSSSSIWYELAYLEKKGEIRRGQKIWQIAFGSGFKCNSAVWTAL